MKIGFVLDDTLDKPDGVQQYVLTLGTWFSSQGHEVHYLTGQSKRTDVPNVTSLSKNIGVRFNGNRLSIPLPASKEKIASLLRREQFDVLHVQMPHSPLLAARVVRKAAPNTAIVGTFHIAPFSKLETVATRALGLWLKPNLSNFDTVISVSKTAHDFAKKTFHIDSQIVPNLVDISLFQSKSKPTATPQITFLGRLVPRKGCEHLLRAIAILQNTNPELDYQVNICGDGEDRGRLEQLSRELKIDAVVKFNGRVSETEKADILATSQIAVFPSTGGESFGIVLIEAMASGAKVVLAGDNPGYKDVLGSVPEAIINPLQHEAFAERLKECLTDQKLVERLHEQQQAIIKQYDVSVVGPQVFACYQDAIAKRKSHKHNGAYEEA